jgi:HD-like signal output (HDOD) protein
MNPKLQSQLQSQIKRLDSISSAPAILKPLVEMLRLPSEKIKVEDLVKLISCDVSMSAQCLRLANSPLFGRRETETVRSAVMALGIDRVRSLLLGLCLNHVIPPDKWVLDPGAFWRHSLGCALVTQRIAKIIDYPDTEKAYLAGLLHDLGFLANSVLYHDDFRECMRLAAEQHAPLDGIEQQILGFTHGDSGAMLCAQWGLPKDLADAARCHHDVSLLAAAGPLACLVHLGDQLCRVRYLGHGYEESVVFDLAGDEAWKTLGKSHPAIESMDLARFTLDIDGAMDQIVATVEAVFGGKQQAAPAAG